MRASLLVLFFAWPGYLTSALPNLIKIPQPSDFIDEPSSILLGDLARIGATTPAGAIIQATLQRRISAQVDNSVQYTRPPKGIESSACRRDICCLWSYIVEHLVEAFTDVDGYGCSALARTAIRIGFHDAGAWNASLPVPEDVLAFKVGGGGADGSILLSVAEAGRPENRGMNSLATLLLSLHHSYNHHVRAVAAPDPAENDDVVSLADLVQMAAKVATVTCPGGPRIRALVGRQDLGNELPPPPERLLPRPDSNAQTMLDMFAAKTLSATDLVALIGAHTVSRQFFVDPTRAGAPQDSTDGVFDTRYYNETAAVEAPEGVYRFKADMSLAADPRVRAIWASFAQDHEKFAEAYASAYFRLSLLGVQNLNGLTDCSSVLPPTKAIR